MSKSFFENGIISALGNDIQVDTNLVRSSVTSLDGINNNLESAFDSVIKSVNKLNSSWEGSASSKAISKFNKIKSDFCGASGRKAIMQSYIKFLSDAVATGYEATEDTNIKLSELFKWTGEKLWVIK